MSNQTNNTPAKSPLKQTGHAYVSQYQPDLLYPIPRKPKREQLNISHPLPFYGVDRWNCYELSWLDSNGKPMVAIATFAIPADSEYLIESKSLKLYLNSFNQTKFAEREAVIKTLQHDLQQVISAPLDIALTPVDKFPQLNWPQWPQANLDDQNIVIDTYEVSADLLKTSNTISEETLSSHLLKSNCLVTGQPDWGSILIQYKGPTINRESLLRYLVSFRNHNEFHEQCIERIFIDILTHCKPQHLSIYAAYTRRGGIDICPFRSTDAVATAPAYRHPRQ